MSSIFPSGGRGITSMGGGGGGGGGADVIKLDYGLAEEMATTFNAGAEQLQDTLQAMQKVANMLEEGALLGAAGDAFVSAIRDALSSSISKLTEKFQELQKDVNDAINLMKAADEESESQF